MAVMMNPTATEIACVPPQTQAGCDWQLLFCSDSSVPKISNNQMLMVPPQSISAFREGLAQDEDPDIG
jgi:hypothetical protein